MNQQDGWANRNTTPAIKIEIIWSSKKGADDIKEEAHNQDRKDELVGGAYTSTGRVGE